MKMSQITGLHGKSWIYVTVGQLLTLLAVQGRELMGFHNTAGFVGVMQVGKIALKYPWA